VLSEPGAARTVPDGTRAAGDAADGPEAGARGPAKQAGGLGAVFDRARGWLGACHWADLLSLLLLGVLPIVMVLTLDDYGLTYDEEPHLRLGERVLDFYTNGFDASRSLRNTAYGAGFDLFAAVLRRVSPWDEYETNHILCVFVAQLGYLGTWKLGRFAGGPTAGFAALALLVLEPVYYGHAFNNPKDIPFAVGYVWGLYAIARLLAACADPGPSAREAGAGVAGAVTGSAAAEAAGARHGPGFRLYLGLALALGLGMSVRVGGAILIAYLVVFLCLIGVDRWWRSGRESARALLPVAGKAALAALASWVLMLLFWPRALSRPIDGPAAALETVTKYTAYDSPTLLGGKLVSSTHVPWNYLPTYFAFQLPELVSVCFIATCVAACVWLWRSVARREPLPWLPALLAFAVLLPPAYAIVRGSTLYNGLRHFLFVIPPLCVLGGLGLARFGSWLGSRRRVLLAPFLLAVGVLAAEPALALVRLHPHQHVFFNTISGGLVPAVKNYETEYYGSVYRDLNAQLVEAVWEQGRQDYLNRTFTVSGCGSKLFFTRNLPLNFQFQAMRNADKSDFYATYARDRCLERYRDREVVARVDREGATLGVARELGRKRLRKAPVKPR
jgi:hypothetical protein